MQRLSNNSTPVNLTDSFGRIAKKLRISVIDRCNLQCAYCLPKNVNWYDPKDILSFEKIVRFASILAKLGVEKIRLTGGEPLLRKDLEILVYELAKIRGIKKISLTTNGIMLSEKIHKLKKAGLSNINLSLDTFKKQTFQKINGTDGLDKTLSSIKLANKLQMNLKINNVVLKGWNDDEVVDFAQFSRLTGNEVRFIEFMPLDGSGIWNEDLVVTKKEIMDKLSGKIGKLIPLENEISSPAKSFTFSDGRGKIGFIPSISEPFCQNCDRLRLTSDGRLLTCLYENPGFAVGKLLEPGNSDKEIIKTILNCMKNKPEGIIKIIQNKQLKPKLNLMNTIGG